MLKELRQKANKTQLEVALAVGIDVSSYAKYESENKRLLKASTLTSYLIANELNIELSKLIKEINKD